MTHPDPIWPPALAPGARVALVAPAGPLGDPVELARAEANARAFGWEPVVAPNAMARAGYLAGDDAARLGDLNAALADDVDGVWCLRGGYGAMRLLDGVDWDALVRRPRALIGFSDITALHLAAAVRAPGLVSFHGPTARGTLTPFSHESLGRAVVARVDPCGAAPDAATVRGGRAEGRLAGGNLALLAALAGTPYAPRLADAIVVLEDVGEPMYRVDRMLRQLLLADALTGCRALVFGHCTDCADAAGGDGRHSLADLVGEAAELLGVPAVVGVPVGHITDQWTLPLGARAELDADARTLHVHGATAA
ncbi:peptidase U61 LD-carboxypeptidase A [Gemmatirosa kalamazoonensis]|uniref:Peptidase U61 LD-carboxypeptidase A n=1 Tax=Gemmatirosa kalamazoonensis TaxID=861299 RepID=W0RMB6_9BACT|nr:LD-carboxypeptidase [Gemmatirosa kalamazoonensis]AHG91906.1 peptidase U61 LD-carboxypeptidase A [Gemmatirosa kalamazoonensis]